MRRRLVFAHYINEAHCTNDCPPLSGTSSAPPCTHPLHLQSLQCTPCLPLPGAVADDDDDDEDYDELSLIVAALRRHFLSIIAYSSTVGA